jgi:hypothetical protein
MREEKKKKKKKKKKKRKKKKKMRRRKRSVLTAKTILTMKSKTSDCWMPIKINRK